MSSGADHTKAGSGHPSTPRGTAAHFPARAHHAASALAAGTAVNDYRVESVLGVNAFDQPAVEESKRLAREYLVKA